MEYQYNDPYLNRHNFSKLNEDLKKHIDFIITASRITDFEEFCKAIDETSNKDKEELENAIIVLFKLKEFGKQQEPLINFLEKYKKYLDVKLDSNPEEFYNNQFCWYILTTKYEGKSQEFDFIKTKEADNLDKINAEIDRIIDKFNDNEELTISEKKFIENYMLNGARFYFIESNMIFEYFDRYPIKSTNTFRDKQLFLLSIVAKKLSEVGIESYLSLSEEIDYENAVAGVASKTSKGIPIIRVNAIDERILTNDTLFFDNIYVLYHEIGHAIQKKNRDTFSPEMQELFDREDYIVKNDHQFYLDNHDYFMMERQANEYAIAEIGKDFPNNEVLKNRCEREAEKLDQLDITKPDFFDIELQLYQELCSGFQK